MLAICKGEYGKRGTKEPHITWHRASRSARRSELHPLQALRGHGHPRGAPAIDAHQDRGDVAAVGAAAGDGSGRNNLHAGRGKALEVPRVECQDSGRAGLDRAPDYLRVVRLPACDAVRRRGPEKGPHVSSRERRHTDAVTERPVQQRKRVMGTQAVWMTSLPSEWCFVSEIRASRWLFVWVTIAH